MNRFHYIAHTGVMKEYKPMSWSRRSRRAYSRRVDRALRYLTPPDISFEDLVWVIIAAIVAGMALGFPVAFVCWWLGII